MKETWHHKTNTVIFKEMVICELPEKEFKTNTLKKFNEIPEGTVNLMNIEKLHK